MRKCHGRGQTGRESPPAGELAQGCRDAAGPKQRGVPGGPLLLKCQENEFYLLLN